MLICFIKAQKLSLIIRVGFVRVIKTDIIKNYTVKKLNWQSGSKVIIDVLL